MKICCIWCLVNKVPRLNNEQLHFFHENFFSKLSSPQDFKFYKKKLALAPITCIKKRLEVRKA